MQVHGDRVAKDEVFGREKGKILRFKPLNLVGGVPMVALLPPLGGVMRVAAAGAAAAAAAELHG